MVQALAEKVMLTGNELDVFERKLDRAVELSEELVALQQTHKPGRRVPQILDELAGIVRYISSRSAVADIVGLRVQRVIHTITEGYELEQGQNPDDPAVIARRSLYLYKGLHDGTGFTKKVLEKMHKTLH